MWLWLASVVRARFWRKLLHVGQQGHRPGNCRQICHHFNLLSLISNVILSYLIRGQILWWLYWNDVVRFTTNRYLSQRSSIFSLVKHPWLSRSYKSVVICCNEERIFKRTLLYENSQLTPGHKYAWGAIRLGWVVLKLTLRGGTK